MDDLREFFSDEERCRETIREARQVFTNPATTEEQYDMMEKTLGLMYLNCPESIENIARATVSEASRRRVYFELREWAKNN